MLKALVGCYAHGLAGLERDKDFRGIFVVPRADRLRRGFTYGDARMVMEEAMIGEKTYPTKPHADWLNADTGVTMHRSMTSSPGSEPPVKV